MKDISSKPLTSKDREKLRSDALAAVISSIGQTSFIPNLLDYVRIDVPFVTMLLFLLDKENRPFHIYDTIRNTYRINLDYYLDGVYQLDPIIVRFQKDRKTCAMLIGDVAPDKFQQTEYFRRYYKIVELRDEISFFIDLGDKQFLSFSICRHGSGGDAEPRFRRRELTHIERDLPVLNALCRQHFSKSSYDKSSLMDGSAEKRLQFALDRFGGEILTPREREVAVLILKGHSSKSTAREIDISPETVKIHRKNIYRKLEVSSQSDLFVRFLNTLG